MTIRETEPMTERRDWMGLLARCPAAHLSALWGDYAPVPKFDWLRAPEVGAVMVRGRMGGTGAPFNLGEMSVTRSSVVLSDGTVGHGYVQGRDKSKCELAALVDALMQTTAATGVRQKILVPLHAEMEAAREKRASKAAATKVEFFTMVRGEDT